VKAQSKMDVAVGRGMKMKADPGSRTKPALGLLLLVLVLSACATGRSGVDSVDPARQREYANALYNEQLYTQAIDEYRHYLDSVPGDSPEAANVQFTIANIYFERLGDYQNALAAYLKVKVLFPQSSLKPEVEKQIVACLERLNRSVDARQALKEATALDPEQAPPSLPGTVFATIGDRTVTSGDLKHLISLLPDYVQSQLASKEARLQFLRSYLASELLFAAAKRQGLENEKSVVEAVFEAKKNYMVQLYLEEQLKDQVKISDEDVQLYFTANRDRYAERDQAGKVKKQKPFDEVKEQAAQDLYRERRQKALDALLERMMKADNVRVFEDRLGE